MRSKMAIKVNRKGERRRFVYSANLLSMTVQNRLTNTLLTYFARWINYIRGDFVYETRTAILNIFMTLTRPFAETCAMQLCLKGCTQKRKAKIVQKWWDICLETWRNVYQVCTKNWCIRCRVVISLSCPQIYSFKFWTGKPFSCTEGQQLLFFDWYQIS
jgi:hypothetical protein